MVKVPSICRLRPRSVSATVRAPDTATTGMLRKVSTVACRAVNAASDVSSGVQCVGSSFGRVAPLV